MLCVELEENVGKLHSGLVADGGSCGSGSLDLFCGRKEK